MSPSDQPLDVRAALRTAARRLGDEFDGTSLEKCRWTVENEDPDRLSVGGGSLKITPPPGQDMHAGGGEQAARPACTVKVSPSDPHPCSPLPFPRLVRCAGAQ